jgi:hypothetical protein
MPTFFSILSAEFYKSLRNKEGFIFLAMGLLPILFSTLIWLKWDYAAYDLIAGFYKDKNPFVFFYGSLYGSQGFILSLLLMAFVYLSIDAEHNAKSWKALYAIPNMTHHLVWAKQLIIIGWVFVMLQIQYPIIVLATNILEKYNLQIPFIKFQPHYDLIWLMQLKVLISALPFIVFQVWFNMLVPKKILVNILVIIFSWFFASGHSPQGCLKAVCSQTFYGYDVKKTTFSESFHFFNAYEQFSLIILGILLVMGYLLTPKIINKIT